MTNVIVQVLNNLTEYIEIKIEKSKLQIISKVAKALAGVLSFLLVVTIGLFFVLFLSFAIAYLISDILNNSSSGFFIVAGFYLLIMILSFILLKSKKIQHQFESIILKMTEKKDNEDN